MSKLPGLSEHQLQQLLINYLRVKGWYVMRLNSGKYSVGEGRFKRFIMGQEAGTPDLVAFKPFSPSIQSPKRLITIPPVSGIAELLFVEVKSGKNKPSDLQSRKMEELEQYGARCLVIHSLEELEAYL